MPQYQSNAPGRLYGYDHKELRENLAPLYRFLFKNVGRIWNEVYSEICENIRIDNAVQSHVRDHVDSIVEINIIMTDNEPYDTIGHPIWEGFYVNPETGKLCHKKHKYYRKQKTKKYVDGVDNYQYHIINGIWYEIELKPLPPKRKDISGKWWLCDFFYDVMKKGDITHDECRRIYGGNFYAFKKRQLNKKEIKKLKLWESEVSKAA